MPHLRGLFYIHTMHNINARYTEVAQRSMMLLLCARRLIYCNSTQQSETTIDATEMTASTSLASFVRSSQCEIPRIPT